MVDRFVCLQHLGAWPPENFILDSLSLYLRSNLRLLLFLMYSQYSCQLLYLPTVKVSFKLSECFGL